MTEQNNELLMKNHGAHPTGYASFPEVNAVIYNKSKRKQNHNHGRERGHGKGRNSYRYNSRNK